jgi:alcohol/geraniol dehydrogenase (NADP+)
MKVQGYAAKEAKGKLSPFEYELGDIGSHEVDVKIDSCGLCHSDISMLDNDWGMTKYPFVPGHEIIGTVAAIGGHVKNLRVGQKVGIGWFTGSCMTCDSCMSGNHNLCSRSEGTIVSRHGGFANYVRAKSEWVIPLPEGLDYDASGPLFCGGITVFSPLIQNSIKPIDKVGVIGIGGLGHLAILFLRAWGCEVTAFSSSADKEQEAKSLGAHHFVNSTDSKALAKIAGSFDFIISTVNVSLDWSSYLNCLKPQGNLHVVGAVLKPIEVGAFSLIGGEKSISGSPTGSPYNIRKMLEFCARHSIKPVVEEFPFSQVNEAIEKLRAGKVRYRVVLKH